MTQTVSNSRNRKIIVLRHGERMDFTFGYSWIQEHYVRTDANMPERLPKRKSHRHWLNDTPLTVLGEQLAESVGSSMKASGVKLSHVFVSPAFRCLQTASGVLKGLGVEKELPMNIDPGLFEWTGFYRHRWPDLLTTEEAAEIFNINVSYDPVVLRSELEAAHKESISEHYDRNFRATKEILERHEGDVLIVAHAGSLETCTRQLIGKEKRSMEFLIGELVHRIPYLAAIGVEQVDDSFRLIQPPCKNPHNKSYDWKIFLDDSLIKHH